MTLKGGILFGCAAATLFAQELELKHRADVDMEMAVEKLKRVPKLLDQDNLLEKLPADLMGARKALTIDAEKHAREAMLAHKELLSGASSDIFLAKQAADKAAFALQSFQYSKGGGALTDEEELKMMAIDSLTHSDIDRAIPLVDKVLQNQQASMRLRMRALQALGNSSSTKAREIVVRVAKDGSQPELQSRAIQLLGSRENSQNKQILNEIYASSTNADIKRQVLRSWAGGDDWQKLLEIAKTEKNEELRNRAIQHAGSVRSAGVSEALVELYNSASDSSTRHAILRALSNQSNAKPLIALARKETNPDLKRAAVQQLSRMKGDEVMTYLTELLSK
jgi:HEAT repeat protein